MSQEETLQELMRRVARLERSPLARALNDADYVAALAMEMGLDESVLENSKVPQVHSARQRLALRLRSEKKWGWQRIGLALGCSDRAARNLAAVKN
jgi:hypothetical protein